MGIASVFHVKVDNAYIGKFKSSGMIVSTGTGATGLVVFGVALDL